MMATQAQTIAGTREPLFDRALIRVGVREDAARIIGATPSLRVAWLLAAAGVALFAVWGPQGDPRVLGMVLLLAPVLPVAGVATAYGPWADPMFDVAQASPSSGMRVLLLRTVAVLLTAGLLVTIVTLSVPTAEVAAIAWVLPALALCASSLMLGTFMPLRRAAILVGIAWVAIVVGMSATSASANLARGRAQLAFFVIAICASIVLARRRHHLEVEDLHSRRALVDAADAERRRIERNIHDGAQQQLVAIGVKAGLARTIVARDPDKAIAILDQVCADADAALQALRDMTRGAYPPILADEGLAAALTAKARGAPASVSVQAEDLGLLPKPVEIAAYYCCSEAMQNALKYARATSITIALRRQVGSLACRITDDGVGFEPSTVRRGVGMRSMAERVEALGGTLEVRSGPGSGATIAATIPLTGG
jgi:signal transduction histidine kinase